MQSVAAPVAKLIEELSKLPTIGPKTAQRLTFFLLRASTDQVRDLARAIVDVKERIIFCSTCFNITEEDPCPLCRSADRDQGVVCVVEEPLDVIALERTRTFRGQYHVLHGVISPVDGVLADDLKIRELLLRLKDGAVHEVILATNPNLEGEVTAMHLQRLIAPLGVKVTRLARGLPVGGDLEYADEVTLTRAIEGRREM